MIQFVPFKMRFLREILSTQIAIKSRFLIMVTVAPQMQTQTRALSKTCMIK